MAGRRILAPSAPFVTNLRWARGPIHNIKKEVMRRLGVLLVKRETGCSYGVRRTILLPTRLGSLETRVVPGQNVAHPCPGTGLRRPSATSRSGPSLMGAYPTVYQKETCMERYKKIFCVL